MLFDANTFVEIETLVESRGDNLGWSRKKYLAFDGVIIGYSMINGRIAYASIEDFTVMGGTLGEYHSKKSCQIHGYKRIKMRAPYISINDSGGARIEEGICSLD